MFSVFRACVSFGPRNRSIGAAAKSQVCFHGKWWESGSVITNLSRGFNVHSALSMSTTSTRHGYTSNSINLTICLGVHVFNSVVFIIFFYRSSQTARTQSKGSRGFMAGHFQIPLCIASKTVWSTTLHKCLQEQPASR